MAIGGEVQHFENGGQPRVGRASQAVGSDFFPESQRTTAAKKKRTLDTVLDFSIQGNQLLGNELMLTRVRDGNLRQGPLSASEF